MIGPFARDADRHIIPGAAIVLQPGVGQGHQRAGMSREPPVVGRAQRAVQVDIDRAPAPLGVIRREIDMRVQRVLGYSNVYLIVFNRISSIPIERQVDVVDAHVPRQPVRPAPREAGVLHMAKHSGPAVLRIVAHEGSADIEAAGMVVDGA